MRLRPCLYKIDLIPSIYMNIINPWLAYREIIKSVRYLNKLSGKLAQDNKNTILRVSESRNWNIDTGYKYGDVRCLDKSCMCGGSKLEIK